MMFAFAAYFDSFKKGKIDKNLFTVSQSLAFGNKVDMGILLTTGISLLMFLNYYRGLPYMYVKILLFVIFSFILSIFWVTTYYSISEHQILALITNIIIIIQKSYYIQFHYYL